VRKKKKKNNKKGFTITELAVVLVIVAILALVAVPIYRRYVREAVANEGRALVGEIAAAQEIYFARYGRFFHGTAGMSFSDLFGVDARRNRYFRFFYVSATDTGFTVVTDAEGITLNLTGTITAPPVVTETWQ